MRSILAFAFALAAVVSVVVVSCGPFDDREIWFCLNPETGKLDNAPHDDSHYVNGVYDPCHCYDPCGPQASCPTVVDAGPLPPGCDAGAGGGS